MKKILISVFMTLILVTFLAVPAIADAPSEVGKTASVTVKAYKSVTLSDAEPSGLQFGSLDPGTVKQAEANSPSITISAAVENNADVVVSISGTDFTGTGHTLTIDNAFWNTSNDPDGATQMTTTPASVATLSAGTSVDIYHWLSIPNGQAADIYSSTFTYKTE